MTSNTPWLQQLASAPLSERGAALEALVTREFRDLLLMSDAERLPLDESYFELGLTSIGATEIQQRLEAALGRRIDSSSLFNNPTIDHLLAHLRSEVIGEYFATTAPAPADVPAAASAQGSSPKDLLNSLLDELYES